MRIKAIHTAQLGEFDQQKMHPNRWTWALTLHLLSRKWDTHHQRWIHGVDRARMTENNVN